MKQRLLISGLIGLLLTSGAAAYYAVWRDKPSPPVPPVKTEPAILPTLPPAVVPKPAEPAAPVVEYEESDEPPQVHTVTVPLMKEELVKEQKPPDASMSLKQSKPAEILPGVTVENKELRIQLDRANESLNFRKSKEAEDQTQMLWRRKF